jgi:hypothetical protein
MLLLCAVLRMVTVAMAVVQWQAPAVPVLLAAFMFFELGGRQALAA